jgi:hypothetical protein
VNTAATYSALRRVLVEHDVPPAALHGLSELAGLLSERHGLSPAAATRWMTGPSARLDEQRPLDVWVEDAGRVIDTVRAERTGRLR